MQKNIMAAKIYYYNAPTLKHNIQNYLLYACINVQNNPKKLADYNKIAI